MKRLTGAFALAALSLFMLAGYLRSDLDGGTPSALAAFALVVLLPAAALLGLMALLRRLDRLSPPPAG